MILTYIFLTSTIRKVRRNSKENLPIDIGTSRIKVTVIKMLSYSYPYTLDAIPAVVSWPLIAGEMPWLTELKLIVSLNGRSS